jgi:hypothetical protein
VYRTDLGVTQTYYGLFNASTNPGGRDTAGWYNEEKNMGLEPVRPGTVTFISGAGTVSSLGVINITSNVTGISIDNVFTSQYRNYLLKMRVSSSTNAGLWARSRSGGADYTGAQYYFASNRTRTSGTYQGTGGGTSTVVQFLTFNSPGSSWASATIEINDPAITTSTTFQGTTWESDATSMMVGTPAGLMFGSGAHDGITIFTSTGTFNGEIQIFGYNDK